MVCLSHPDRCVRADPLNLPLPHSRFSTGLHNQAGRFRAWRESISVLYEPSLVQGDDPLGFEAEAEGYQFGPLSLIRCASSRQHFARSQLAIDHDGIDHYMIQIFSRGRCHARLPRDEVVMQPGDICIFDNARTLDSTNERFDLISLFVPRRQLASQIRAPEDRHCTHIRAQDPFAGLLRTHLSALFRAAPHMSLEEGQRAVEPTISLLAATLNGTPAENAGGAQATRLAIIRCIRDHVDRRLEDPDFGPDELVSAFGISRTRLYRLFGFADGVAAYIRNRRLALALPLLSDPKHAHRKIIDIAMSVGFTSETSFARAFRRRYGFAPSEARGKITSQALAGHGSHVRGREDRDWVEWIRET